MIQKKRFNFKIKALFSFLYSWIFAILLLKQEYCLCVYDIRSSLIPKELNFFDTNPAVLGYFLYSFCIHSRFSPWRKPIWDRNLYVSLCIEVLQSDKHWAKTIVVVRIAIRMVECKATRTNCNVTIVTSAFEEWIRRVREGRVVTV